MTENDKQKTYRAGGFRGENKDRARTVEILPSPEVLESYNYVVEGSAEMILAMFDYEQQHRHEMEKQSLRIHAFSTMLGQILGFFVAIAAFSSATMLGIYGSDTLAAVIWVFAAAIVVMAGMVWAYVGNIKQRTLIDRAVIKPASEK